MDIMNEIEIKKVAKKIQHTKTFLELHDIIIMYANLNVNLKNPPVSSPPDPWGVFNTFSDSFILGNKK